MVRDALPSDATSMAEINVAGWRTAYAGIVPDDVIARQRREPLVTYFTSDEAVADGMRTLVVELDGVVVGFAHMGPLRPEPDEALDACELWGMYVDPAHQGHGHGRALMTATMDHFRSVGCPVAYLWVLRDNAAARGFYESQGWELDSSAYRTDPIAQVRYAITTGA